MGRAGMLPINKSETQAEGPLALDIQSHSGQVTVIVNHDLTEPIVTAMARSTKPSTVGQWTAASMATDAGRPVLRVLSAPPGENAPDVDIVVRVPDCAGVRVRCDDGQVTLHGVHGAIDVQTSIGSVTANAILIDTDTPLTDPMLLRASRGNIELRMPTGSAGTFLIETPAGVVHFDAVTADLRDVSATVAPKGSLSNRTWTGILNRGKADMHVIADDGDVTVSVGRYQ
jgi:hypothetical protein